jgi:hypothetical protein
MTWGLSMGVPLTVNVIWAQSGTLQYRMLVEALLPSAAKFKLLGIDLVDEHGMSAPSP